MSRRQQTKVFHFQHRIGEVPVLDFFSNYKNINRSLEREEHLKEPQTAFLYECEKQNLIPVPFGFVKYKGKEEEINVSNYLMGKDYARAYG